MFSSINQGLELAPVVETSFRTTRQGLEHAGAWFRIKEIGQELFSQL